MEFFPQKCLLPFSLKWSLDIVPGQKPNHPSPPPLPKTISSAERNPSPFSSSLSGSLSLVFSPETRGITVDPPPPLPKKKRIVSWGAFKRRPKLLRTNDLLAFFFFSFSSLAKGYGSLLFSGQGRKKVPGFPSIYVPFFLLLSPPIATFGSRMHFRRSFQKVRHGTPMLVGIASFFLFSFLFSYWLAVRKQRDNFPSFPLFFSLP